MRACKTLRRESDRYASRRRRCAGPANGHMDEQMDEQTGEQTDCARFIHIQMRTLYDRANESENALEHLGLEIIRCEVKVQFDLFTMPYGWIPHKKISGI